MTSGGDGIKPIDPNDPDARKAAFIDIARSRGATWDMIAVILGVKDRKAAKAYREELGRRVTLRQAGVLEPAASRAVLADPDVGAPATGGHGERVPGSH